MNNLSIEELKEMYANILPTGMNKYSRAIAELIAIRELKGDQSPVANPVLAYADSYRAMARQGSDSVPIWAVITDLERNIAPLFTAPQKPVVLPELRQLKEAVDFYLQVQKDNPPIEQGMHKDADEWLKRAAIEAAGGIVKDGD